MKGLSIKTLLICAVLGIGLFSCTHNEISKDKSKEGGCDYSDSVSDSYALALSGGGYRAMLYHVGALWRMHELGLLQKMDVISSVSGGSITSAWLGLQWDQLKEPSANFEQTIAQPILEFADTKIDVSATLKGIFLPGTVGSYVHSAYDKHLFKGKMLSDLPDTKSDDNPRFVILSTNLKTGKLVKFTNDCYFHYPTGQVKNPVIKVSTAVGASSAFPPFLSPVELRFEEGAVDRIGNGRNGLSRLYDNPAFRNHYTLTDGGVYDNLGVEEINDVRKYKNIFVSDAGGKYTEKESISSFWPLHILSVLSTIDSQVRAQRIQKVFDIVSNPDGANGAFWQIGTYYPNVNAEISHSTKSIEIPQRLVCLLASTPTRLSKIPKQHQKLLINWGYMSSDRAIRTYFDELKDSPVIANMPYPKAVDGWEKLFSNKYCRSTNLEKGAAYE